MSLLVGTGEGRGINTFFLNFAEPVGEGGRRWDPGKVETVAGRGIGTFFLNFAEQVGVVLWGGDCYFLSALRGATW